MSWILSRTLKDGTLRFYIRDIRDGRQVVIPTPEGTDRRFAERMKEQYDSRRALEKHGYDDKYAAPLPEDKSHG